MTTLARRAACAALALTLGACAQNTATTPLHRASAGSATLSKAAYADKTLAGIIGEVGAFLTGYEFASEDAGPHPDDWFDPANGPYAGNFTHFTPPGDPSSYVRLLAPGRVRGQDNYFMDFFNQLVLKEHGSAPTDADLRAEYLAHNIIDYGGDGVANRLMAVAGMLPFQTGEGEFNDAAWCCEPYIETDTLGFVAPGMPGTARDLATRFATVSGTFDTTTWSQFLATLMSLAYFETDARVALQKAAATLPPGSWPAQVYARVAALYTQNPTDWRWAQGELLKSRRLLYAADDDRVIADINQGTFMIAVLYGGNDYLRTLKIAAIGGNEGVDNATPVGGLMGVIKGMAGTPQAFKDRVYANGAGVFVNDTSGVLQTYVTNTYPAEQTFTDLAALYRQNFEAILRANGGTVGATDYTVPLQALQRPVVVPIDNADFETGTLAGWTLSAPSNGQAESQTGFYNAHTTYTLSHSGQYKATLFTDASVHDVRLSRSVGGLTPGARYRLRAYVESMGGANAELFVQIGGEILSAAAFSTEDMGSAGQQIKGRTYAQRTLEFVAAGSSVTLGYHLQSDAPAWAAVDDVTLEALSNPTAARYEAEAATLTGGAGVYSSSSASGGLYAGGLNTVGASARFTVTVPTAGEYRFAVNYANPSGPEIDDLYGSDTWALPASLTLAVNGVDQGRVFFPRTPAAGVFSANVLPVPVTLSAGANTITLRRAAGAGVIDLDFADLSAFPQPVYADATSTPLNLQSANLLTNASFEQGGASQTPQGWSTWCGASGTDCDADYTETGGHDGALRLTHHKTTPYEVYTKQTVTGLTNGAYTLRAWVVGGGGQHRAFMSVKDYGGAELTRDLPQSGWPNWTPVEIRDIPVTNGQATVGFYSNAGADQWLSVDDVQFVRP